MNLVYLEKNICIPFPSYLVIFLEYFSSEENF